MVAKQIQASALASVLAALALAVPADAALQDLRSPDVRDAAAPQAQKRGDVVSGGLRAPDWLSPHAREPAPLIAPSTGTMAPTVVEITPADGFDWTSAGIGAGGSIALVVLALAGVAAVTSRSRPAPR
jgi:hypothetical protein